MNYIDRIQNSVEYIHLNYNAAITLDDLAEKAFCSKFHYLRIFRSLVGESPIEYLKKYRLDKAAFLLTSTNKTIIDIALECGFNSPIVFCRLFKNLYGITPTSYKKNRVPLPEFIVLNLTKIKPKMIKSSFLFGPRFTEKTDFKIVGIQCKTTPESNLNNRVGEKIWRKFCPQIPRIENQTNDGIKYGISYYQPTINKYIYIACIEVSSVDNVPNGMVSMEIPKCKYAVFTIKGERSKLIENFYFSIDHIFGKWLPFSGCELCAEFDMFELYDSRFYCDKDTQMDLYIPIK